jgi:hypothetical protein
MPGKMCHDVSGDKKSIGNWQMEIRVIRLVTRFWHKTGTFLGRFSWRASPAFKG